MSAQIYSSGGAESLDTDSLISRCSDLEALAVYPFSDQVLDCLKLLSKRLISSEYARAMPQIMALGYWIRPSALKGLQQKLQGSNDQNTIISPRGLALHLPPQNVDTLFAYSWVLSYLVGNCNVVRVGSEPGDVSRWLIEQILLVLEEAGESHRSIFCSYQHSDTDIASKISALCDLRVIWGGDEKIKTVSQSTTRPDGLTLGFSDRKSMCLVNTGAYKQSTVAEKMSLAQNLYNDIFWFDQLGCGSPRLIAWVGAEKPEAQELYQLIDDVANEKDHQTATGVDLQKFSFANVQLAQERASKVDRVSSNVLVIDTESDSSLFDQVMGGGLLYQVQVSDIGEVSKFLRPDIQTITEFGFDHSAKQELAKEMGLKGGYRIVPTGKALEFNPIWDGVELMSHFTRQVTVS